MKKILSFLAAGALALGLIGCSGDLHDNVLRIIDLSQGGVAGDFDSPANWSEKEAWTTVDTSTATYTFNFTTKADSASDIGFKINSQLKWNVDGYTEFNVSADGAAATASFKTGAEMSVAGNAQILGVKPSTSYVMTVVCNRDTTATVKVVSAGGGTVEADPVPYYLDGMFFTGCGATGNNFTMSADALLWKPTVTKKTGEVLYTKDFTFNACADTWHTGYPAVIKIATSDWKSTYGDTPITVGEDFVKLVEGGDNAGVTGLTEGKAYRAEVLTNPDKEVFVKIYEIAKLTLTFQATGLEDGYEAWINGTFWGSSWPNGWPIASWGQPVLEGLTPAVADNTGVAVFSEKFNVTTVAKIGEKLSYNFKAIACENEKWEAAKLESGDLTCEFTVESEGTYLVSVDIETENVTVTKQ